MINTGEDILNENRMRNITSSTNQSCKGLYLLLTNDMIERLICQIPLLISKCRNKRVDNFGRLWTQSFLE